jgi:hypothetical protein
MGRVLRLAKYSTPRNSVIFVSDGRQDRAYKRLLHLNAHQNGHSIMRPAKSECFTAIKQLYALARQLCQKRGEEVPSIEDWLRAEQELKQEPKRDS